MFILPLICPRRAIFDISSFDIISLSFRLFSFDAISLLVDAAAIITPPFRHYFHAASSLIFFDYLFRCRFDADFIITLLPLFH
jgi:hypothetical protein